MEKREWIRREKGIFSTLLFVLVCFVFKIFLFISFYFWLCWVFIAVRGLSLVAASRGYSLLLCTGFLLQWFLFSGSTGSRHTGPVVMARRLYSVGSVAVAQGLSYPIA